MRPILDLRSAKVAVELTNRCNLRCGMCPMNKLERPDADMAWPLVEKVAGELRAAGVQVSWLHEMGEPLMYPRITEAVELFPGCSVSTNATKLDRAMGERLLATSLRRIRLCLDTVNPEVYPTVRRGGVFDKVLANIRAFLEQARGATIEVEIQRMISRPTARETVADFERLLDLDRFANARVIEKTCEGLDTSDATDLHESFYGCFQGYPFRWFIVLADGTVTHCCYDANGTQPIGDLNHQTVAEVLASPTLERYMTAFKNKDWATLPRCGECYKNATGKAVMVDQLQQLGHRLDRVVPVKRIARKIINR